jgi:tRNA dimethylallyltransferase
MLEPLVLVVGPTATGKSAVAIDIAKRLSGEIISGDSTQVYRGLTIGTAKASTEERAIVPHHLIDIIGPEEPFSVAEFQKKAILAIKEIRQRDRLPIIVGGTGLYIRSVVDPYEFAEADTDLELRQSLQQEVLKVGKEEMHRRLSKVDPQSAERIHPADVRRVIRALEVFHLTGRPLSNFHNLNNSCQNSNLSKYDTVWIGLNLDRKLLYQRIEFRVDRMLKAGLVDEVEGLLKQGVDPDSYSMQALGYKEIIGFLKGEYDLTRAIELIKRNTRRFAKRQLTWFRRDSRINWFDVGNEAVSEALTQKICQVICRTTNLHVE